MLAPTTADIRWEPVHTAIMSSAEGSKCKIHARDVQYTVTVRRFPEMGRSSLVSLFHLLYRMNSDPNVGAAVGYRFSGDNTSVAAAVHKQTFGKK